MQWTYYELEREIYPPPLPPAPKSWGWITLGKLFGLIWGRAPASSQGSVGLPHLSVPGSQNGWVLPILWGKNLMGCHHQIHLPPDIQGGRGRKRRWSAEMPRRWKCGGNFHGIWWTLGFCFVLFPALPNFLVSNKIFSQIVLLLVIYYSIKKWPQNLVA